MRILWFSSDICTRQKKPLIEQSFSIHFISFTYVLFLLFFFISLVHIQLMSEGIRFEYLRRAQLKEGKCEKEERRVKQANIVMFVQKLYQANHHLITFLFLNRTSHTASMFMDSIQFISIIRYSLTRFRIFFIFLVLAISEINKQKSVHLQNYEIVIIN